MPFGISGGLSKSKTSSTSTYDKTSTPIVPDWVSGQTQDLAGQIKGLSAFNPTDFVAPATALENQAAAGAASLSGTPWNFDGALDLTRGVAGANAPKVAAQSLLTNLDQYYNPYREQVTDAAMADFDANAGRTRAAQDLELAGSGAFGGSGAAITKSLTEGELARGRNSSLADLLNQMFTTSSSLSADDANRRQSASSDNANLQIQNRAQTLQAAQQLGNLSSQLGSEQRANIDTQATQGANLRAIDQQYRQSPIDDLATQLGLFGDLPLDLFVGQNEKGTETSKGKTSGMTLGASAGSK